MGKSEIVVEESVDRYCNYKWETKYDDWTTLTHSCYLDEGHAGDHICGECEQMPIELHSHKEKEEVK